jgi:type VI secretion system protein ImpF
MLRQAIWDFEPRILRNTVKVRSVVASDQMNRNAVAFEIEGDLWAQPVPLHLFLRTEVDLDSGSFSISDTTAPGSG